MATEKKDIQNVDEYITKLTPEQQQHLKNIRKLVIAASLELEEGLNYSTPAYRINGKLVVGIAAAKQHTGFYVMSEVVMEQFKDKLHHYELAKTSFKIPLNKLPTAALVKQIVESRIKEINNKSQKKSIKNKPAT